MISKRNLIVSTLVSGTAAVLLLAGILLPDQARSETERRSLTQMPKLSTEAISDGSWFENLEDYLADQFPGREWFRKLKAAGNYYLFGQIENNGYYVVDGSLGKLDYPLQERSAEHAAQMFEKVAGIFPEAKVYYTIIPDKNYYLAAEKGYPVMDYAKMEQILEGQLSKMKYISLFDCFDTEDYYRTDLHLRQDACLKAADVLLEGMDNPYRTSDTDFKIKEIPGFYGAWYGQAAVTMPADTIFYLESPAIMEAKVYDHESEKTVPVYLEEALEGTDKYDVFLGGARALLTIDCSGNKTGRELVLVRDSFGSTLAPLLLEGYDKVTLVDLRYISSDLLSQYMEISENCDLLFALNAGIFNSSNMLK